MTTKLWAGAAFAFLTGCAGSLPSGLPPIAESARPYSMSELLKELPGWEIPAQYRDAYLTEQYPKGLQEDFVKLPVNGAQEEIQALRLDGATVATVQGTQRHIMFADGAHQIGYRFTVLRRGPEAWEDLTKTTFTGRWPAHANATFHHDHLQNKTYLEVSDEKRAQRQTYRFDGKRFVEVK